MEGAVCVSGAYASPPPGDLFSLVLITKHRRHCLVLPSVVDVTSPCHIVYQPLERVCRRCYVNDVHSAVIV